jgi:hypothetical protein
VKKKGQGKIRKHPKDTDKEKKGNGGQEGDKKCPT